MPNLYDPPPNHSNDAAVVRRMLAGRRIAVVGLSDDSSRPSFGVANYLRARGKEIIPVNPNCKTVMGLICHPRLEDIPGPVDVVDVFRRPEFCPDVVRSAVQIGAKGVWLQSGIISAEAEAIARDAGIDFVQDRCMKVELMYHSAD